MFNYRRYSIKKISYVLFENYTSNTILDLISALCNSFGIYTGTALFNRQFRKLLVR